MKKRIRLASDPPSVKDLDLLVRQVVRIRDKDKCRRCGNQKTLQVAHVYSRSKKSTRWHLDNLFLLCFNCHYNFAHKNPLEFSAWVKKELGDEVYSQLIMLANSPCKADRNAEKLYLLQKLRELR